MDVPLLKQKTDVWYIIATRGLTIVVNVKPFKNLKIFVFLIIFQFVRSARLIFTNNSLVKIPAVQNTLQMVMDKDYSLNVYFVKKNISEPECINQIQSVKIHSFVTLNIFMHIKLFRIQNRTLTIIYRLEFTIILNQLEVQDITMI